MCTMFPNYKTNWMYSLAQASPVGICMLTFPPCYKTEDLRLREMMALVLSDEASEKFFTGIGGLLHPRDLLHMPSKVRHMVLLSIFCFSEFSGHHTSV